MNWLLAAGSGLLLVLLFPSFSIELLAPVALTPLLIAISRQPNVWRRALLGEICGFIFWMGVCYWIRLVLAAYGGLNEPLSWLAMLLFAITKAIHMAVFAALAGYLLHRWWAIPAIAALWVGIERAHGTFGFAWLALGNAGSDMGLPLRLAPIVGVYGLSFVFMTMNVGVALLLLRRSRRDLAPLLGLLLLFALPAVPEDSTPTREVVTLQPNLEEETPPDLTQLLNLSLIHSLNSPALIAWPEAPTGFYWDRDPVFRNGLQHLARSSQTPVLFSGVTHTDAGAPLNSAILISPEGKELGRYSKTYLVPFGEFVPPLFGWIEKISTEAGSFASGDGPRLLSAGDLRLGTFICYESAFPHLVRRFTALGANVLVNLSNDGWFFRTAAREQHLLLARMRAVENCRWLLRVTNNGITTTIDPAGRIVRTLPEFRETAARLPFNIVDQPTLYSRTGDWFAWSCLGAGLVLALSATRGG